MADQALSKTEWRDRAIRAQNRAKKVAEGFAQQSDKLTGFGIALASAGGMGYYMAKSDDTDGQWWGMDKEVWVTGGLLLISMVLGARKDRGSQMTSNIFLQAATGIGSAYMYGMAHQKTSGTNPDFS